jgi:hypothetical protein
MLRQRLNRISDKALELGRATDASTHRLAPRTSGALAQNIRR